MKILRVRRGFTTNSSASSEWVPPAWQPNPAAARPGAGGAQPKAPAGTTPADAPTRAVPSVPPGPSTPAGQAVATAQAGEGAPALIAVPVAPPAAPTAAAAPAVPASAPGLDTPTTNSLTAGLLLLLVALVFVAERILRRLAARHRKEGDDE